MFINSYENNSYADSYSKIEFNNCYYLAYRDLADIILKYTNIGEAIDFGCGTGRSTRFLKNLGFEATGIDISESMILKAKEIDPRGHYIKIKNGNFDAQLQNKFDLVLSVFTFDNIPGRRNRVKLFKGLKNLLNETGIIVCLDATPDMYLNEWTSFSTKDFPENKFAKSGGIVKIINLESEDRRPCEDIYWTDEDYSECFEKSELELIHHHKVFGKIDEKFNWINETKIAPWIIYVLKRNSITSNEILEKYFKNFAYSLL